jgi:hypothetical protein
MYWPAILGATTDDLHVLFAFYTTQCVVLCISSARPLAPLKGKAARKCTKPDDVQYSRCWRLDVGPRHAVYGAGYWNFQHPTTNIFTFQQEREIKFMHDPKLKRQYT